MCQLSSILFDKIVDIKMSKKLLKIIYLNLINFFNSYLSRISAQDPDPLDPQDFGFLDPYSQKYADPRIRIQGAKYQPKTAKKIFYS